MTIEDEAWRSYLESDSVGLTIASSDEDTAGALATLYEYYKAWFLIRNSHIFKEYQETIFYFWSNRFMTIENVKSDIRFTIDQQFRDNKIAIPFPQRDLHIKSGKSIEG